MNSVVPCLILLDCQSDQVEGPDGRIDAENAAVISRIGQLLHHARNAGWKVCHSQYVGDGPKSARSPISSLRPTAKEPVFLRRGLSAFSDPFLHQVLARNTGGPCLLVGFSAPFSILATVFDGASRDQTMTVVADAVGPRPVEPRNVTDTRRMAFDLIGRISPLMSWDQLHSDWKVDAGAEPVR